VESKWKVESNPDYAVCEPARALRDYVSHYVGFRARGFASYTHSGLPSHHVLLAISLAKPVDLIRIPCAEQPPAAFTAYVSGLQVGPTIVKYEDRRDGLFVHLTAPGARAVLGVTSADLSHRIVDLSDIWGQAAERLVERLMASPTWLQRFAILDQAFRKALRPVPSRPELAWAWSRLAQTHGRVPVRQLADEIGWSRQHFRERFHAELGVTPKTLARIFRFERALRLIKSQRHSLAYVAAACGFHDQAHMTLEWNSLAGCTPGTWIVNELPFFQYAEPRTGE
jgi:AraC-like DNA-binding protein